MANCGDIEVKENHWLHKGMGDNEMKKVLVAGRGAKGGPCASILAGEESVAEIRLWDISLHAT